jgi:hypothetical protein
MLRGDASHHNSEEPGPTADSDIPAGRDGRTGSARPGDGPPGGWGGHPGRPPAEQRAILAQFEAAIAGMHTREIQIGLRQLLSSLDSPRGRGAQGGPGVTRPGETAGPSVVAGDEDAPGVAGSGAGGGLAEVFGAGAARRAERADAGGEFEAEGAAELTVTGRPFIDLDDVPEPVAELVRAVRTPSARRQMERLIGEAELRRPIKIEPEVAARMVRPYSWLLARVGDEGIRLTDAGHLPPGEVAAAIGALGLGAGRGARAGSPVRRENQAPAVVQLRESAQATGLVRKQRGRLLRTAAGQELSHDPAGLWWHLAARMPPSSAAMSEVQPGLILLACVAARFTDTLDLTIARVLTAIGWMNSDGGPLTGSEAARATSGTHAVLRRLGVLPDDPRPLHAAWPALEGVAFARAALATWPAVS